MQVPPIVGGFYSGEVVKETSTDGTVIQDMDLAIKLLSQPLPEPYSLWIRGDLARK